MARRRPYPPSLVAAVTAAMSPHAQTCTIAGCPHCQRWRTRAERALDAIVAAGCLTDAGVIRAAERRRISTAERRRIAAVLRGPAAAADATEVAARLTTGLGPGARRLLGEALLELTRHLADAIDPAVGR
ncbi:hypothetical protein [Micromonospora thermarum]|uniref:Uncharacterized protein n=1 Tax=Micromonospora thermarum TaxID=2720024 RepID=A0ABX0Z8B4_9ACTN|nr:hypothetical protein [Micromonospora thermarum]NJP33718.1 hypothetical protein [Micromonospora thermarum]